MGERGKCRAIEHDAIRSSGQCGINLRLYPGRVRDCGCGGLYWNINIDTGVTLYLVLGVGDSPTGFTGNIVR